MKYYLIIIITFLLGLQFGFAQDHIPLKLKKEIFEDLNLPIRIGKITSSFPQSEIGKVHIPELNKDYPLKFENDMISDITDYISFLQAGGNYKDSIGMNITKLKIKESHNNVNDEVGILELEVDFYKLNMPERVSLFHYTETFEISDKNITPFHEYNIRQGISKSLNWLGKQKMAHLFLLAKQPEEILNPFITSDSNQDVFLLKKKRYLNFRDLETEMIKDFEDRKLNRMIGGRSFINFWAGLVAVTGMVSTVYGVIKYENSLEEDRDAGNAGNYLLAGIGGMATGYIIQAIGKKNYRKRVVKRYNELQLKQNNTVYQPYNPIKINYAIDF